MDEENGLLWYLMPMAKTARDFSNLGKNLREPFNDFTIG
jgi:hypothetical protein